MADIAKMLNPDPMMPDLGAVPLPKVQLGMAPMPVAAQALPTLPDVHPMVRTLNPLERNLDTNQQQLQKFQLQDKGTPWDQRSTGSKIAHVLNVAAQTAGDIFAPGIMARVPGTELNRKLQENELEGKINQEQQEQGQNEERAAQTANLQSETNARDNPQPTFTPIQTDEGYQAFNPHKGTVTPITGAAGEPLQSVDHTKTPEGEMPLGNIPNLNAALQDRFHVLNPGQPLPAQYKLAAGATQKDYDRIDKALEGIEKAQGTKAQQAQANALRQQAMSMARERLDNAEEKQNNPKPTADEQRRADLAENLNENLGTLREIVGRRPELFGPLAGRWAELKQKFGSDDPDLATLQTIEHQIGMAQISAHGMRSAHGIQAAGDSILNHMHSGPHAVMAAIDAAQNSVKTFQGDVQRKGGDIGPPAQHGGPTAGTVENGYRFKGGNPADQKSWEKVQ